ncbi:MAG TPA: fluoride efflux transporter CrcB [Jiangellaceae bacterium]|nr:fluoride efflux transporter CrcB [Jiangellaceae bacterium]
MTFVLVAVGAAVGAPLRYVVDRLIQRRHESVFPWGTLIVNVVGSFVFGLVMAAAMAGDTSPELVAAIGFGFCGGLTTYSTFSYETLQLLEAGGRRYGLANIGGSIVAGIAAAVAGWTAGSALA